LGPVPRERRLGWEIREEVLLVLGEGTPECGMQLGEGTVALVGMHYGSLLRRDDTVVHYISTTKLIPNIRPPADFHIAGKCQTFARVISEVNVV